MKVLVVLVVCLAVLGAAPARSYDEITVADGGTVTGKVTLTRGKPIPKGFNLITFPDPVYCGRISTGTGWRLLEDFTFGPDGGLKDVVVLIKDIGRGKAFTFTPPTIEAKDCRFMPFLTVVRDRHDVVVVNMDPVMHDIQAYETSSHLGARVLFNSPLPMNFLHRRGDLHATHNHEPSKSLLGPIYLSKGRRIFFMQCGFHAYMESWALAIDNPYYALTDSSGRFTINGVPPGAYKLIAWHPQVGIMEERPVIVGPNGTLTENFSLAAPTGRRTAHQVMDNPRFGPGTLGRPLDIVPLVERQQ